MFNPKSPALGFNTHSILSASVTKTKLARARALLDNYDKLVEAQGADLEEVDHLARMLSHYPEQIREHLWLRYGVWPEDEAHTWLVLEGYDDRARFREVTSDMGSYEKNRILNLVSDLLDQTVDLRERITTADLILDKDMAHLSARAKAWVKDLVTSQPVVVAPHTGAHRSKVRERLDRSTHPTPALNHMLDPRLRVYDVALADWTEAAGWRPNLGKTQTEGVFEVRLVTGRFCIVIRPERTEWEVRGSLADIVAYRRIDTRVIPESNHVLERGQVGPLLVRMKGELAWRGVQSWTVHDITLDQGKVEATVGRPEYCDQPLDLGRYNGAPTHVHKLCEVVPGWVNPTVNERGVVASFDLFSPYTIQGGFPEWTVCAMRYLDGKFTQRDYTGTGSRERLIWVIYQSLTRAWYSKLSACSNLGAETLPCGLTLDEWIAPIVEEAGGYSPWQVSQILHRGLTL